MITLATDVFLDFALKKVYGGGYLDLNESISLFENVFDLAADSSVEAKYKIVAVLSALSMRGVAASELEGLLEVMFKRATKVPRPDYELLDVVGTGGDGHDTFNISTAVALIVAAAGVKVAKHGNRAASSKCGSADVLEALGVNILMSPEDALKMLEKTNFCFLFAPTYHPALRNVVPIRRSLPFRTVFNFAGPLANPLKPDYFFIGVSDAKMLDTYASILVRRNVKRALVFMGNDGMDELTLSTTSKALLVHNGIVEELEIDPSIHGFERASPEDLRGGSASDNAKLIWEILSGKMHGPKRDVVLLNAGYALFTRAVVKTPADGIELAEKLINDGKVTELLESIRAFSQTTLAR
ncbi:anthranilate phosphoribosyltransferase [Fervidobacterium thailandense]|uniref:Anthranilate phosphoribosyltransferase n=1 Tax=Fervidobacterium thailandense TaxID=1008305 RepID=A0A1E3G182_9BACT|nr:anthranilate phosphoribosyltransferase [Fervidobacterium thailandense]ODN30011.1 hypothetical protein A4H02_07480 [Fervidobacterium thailandense]